MEGNEEKQHQQIFKKLFEKLFFPMALYGSPC